MGLVRPVPGGEPPRDDEVPERDGLVPDVLDPEGFGPGSVDDLLDAVSTRTRQLVEVLGADGAIGLDRPTSLPEWSRLTIACHLRYGAESTLRMTLAALHDEPTSRYPTGRPSQRPVTLRPRRGESPAAVVTSLAASSTALERVWRDLRPGDWTRIVRGGRPDDPGDLSVAGLLVLRATEVEVHATDLAAGLPDWSRAFVDAALPFRLARLDGRWAKDGVEGSWLLDVEERTSWVVHARAAAATALPVTGSPPPVDARIAGSPRDVLALLLSRHDWGRLTVDGSRAAAEAFARAFPGP